MKPILFSGEMVRAILDGRKTQTRRVIKPQPSAGVRRSVFVLSGLEDGHGRELRCPYGRPGDTLWVRETWQAVSGNDRARHIMTHPRPDRGWLEYAATPRADEPAYKWRPSIHMPRWASRITLEVTGVRVERLQDISEADAWAEGCEGYDDDVTGGKSGYREYCELWEKINGKGSWDLNPWVWVVEFKGVAQ